MKRNQTTAHPAPGRSGVHAAPAPATPNPAARDFNLFSVGRGAPSASGRLGSKSKDLDAADGASCVQQVSSLSPTAGGKRDSLPPASFEWNAQTEHRLAQLWTEGRSASDIARHMGITRNQVIGKAHRMCLKSRPSPIVRNTGRSCRFPLWSHTERPTHLYCGKRTAIGCAWCAEHYAVVYQAGTSSNDLERERKAGRRVRAAMEAGSRSGVMLRAVGRS